MTSQRRHSRSMDDEERASGASRPSGEWDDLVNLKVARHPEDMVEAFQLVYEHYRRMGYVRQHASGLKVTWWDALPDAVRIIALQQGRIVGTLGLVPDSEAGLPADSVASSQLEAMRKRGRAMYEVSGVAMASEPYDMWGVMRMFRYGLRLLLDHRVVTDLVLTVDARDVIFYECVMCCQPLGPARSSSELNGARVVPMRLDLTNLEETYRELYGERTTRNLHRYFFGEYQQWVTVQIAADLQELKQWGTSSFVQRLLDKATEAESEALEITTQRFGQRASSPTDPRFGESDSCAAIDTGEAASGFSQ